jgi:hypothetical protein
VVHSWRGPGPGRPDVPLPPGRMPLVRGGRPLKRWIWVGAFGPDALVCAARVWVAGVPVAWWCAVDRRSGRAVEGSRGVRVSATEVAVHDRFALRLDGGEPVEVVSPHGAQYAWTRKLGAVAAHGWIAVGGERRALEARAIVDESAGYHARRTAWRWSAGVGTASSGAAVAWNLVAGLHDGDGASERTVWVDGEPHEVGRVEFGDDGAWAGAGGSPPDSWRIECAREHVLRQRRNLVVAGSELEQRFGAVTGSLPVAGALSEAWGVMERHDVRW